MSDKQPIKGGEFIIRNTEPKDIFTPEEWTEEHKMIAGMCEDFIHQEIIPHLDRIDSLEEGLMPSLLKKAGDLGFLSVAVPESYGGMGMGFVNTVLVCDYISGATGSFSTAFGAHTGIGTLPIVFYGTEEQKKHYLPKLASGELMGAYALTEPGSGSDALAAKTTAVLSEDGEHYIVKGEKKWAPAARRHLGWSRWAARRDEWTRT